MYNSQDNQDSYLENNIFKGYKNGAYSPHPHPNMP